MKTRLKLMVGGGESILIPGLIDSIAPGQKEFEQAADALERFECSGTIDPNLSCMLSFAGSGDNCFLHLMPRAVKNGIASMIDRNFSPLRLACVEFDDGMTLVSNVSIPWKVLDVINECNKIYRDLDFVINDIEVDLFVENCVDLLESLCGVECEQLRISSLKYIKENMTFCLEAPRHKFRCVAATQIIEYCNALGA
ncbi:hypothetical protein [Paraburkholderia azotifigens]|uniref:Uncharacterized protein n=1 Tax=Paraburkholderia azotifigens TaxID=2057004 RepID=A0ABU9QVB6_9BURK